MSSLLSTGSGGTTAYYESRAEASVYERNAAMALIEAEAIGEEIGRGAETMLAEERTLYGKAGVDIASGSPLAVQEETAAEGKFQQEKVKWAGMEQARMYKWYAKLAKKKGDVAVAQAATSTTMSILSMVAGGIGGAMGGAEGGATGGMGAAQGVISGIGGGGWGTFLSGLMRSRQPTGLGRSYGYGAMMGAGARR